MITAPMQDDEDASHPGDDAGPDSHELLKALLQEMFGMTPEQCGKALGDLDGRRRN